MVPIRLIIAQADKSGQQNPAMGSGSCFVLPIAIFYASSSGYIFFTNYLAISGKLRNFVTWGTLILFALRLFSSAGSVVVSRT